MRRRLALGLLVAALAALPTSGDAHAFRIPMVLVAHPSIKANTAHVHELRAIFLRQSEQLSGQKVIPVTYVTGNALRVDFDERVLGMSADETARYWVDARIRGLGAPPRSVSSPQLLVRVVASLPGAIGYAPKSLVEGTVLKVLRVEGLAQPL
ncbi:MAG: hypothetical protein ABW252_09630 [Polyangiales bacterium]